MSHTSHHPGVPPRGPAGASPPALNLADTAQLRVEALRAAIDVHRLCAEVCWAPLAPIRDLAGAYFEYFTTGEWG